MNVKKLLMAAALAA
jgi:uncharacterized surface protein with fasciclin (FAS1) repeats